MWKEKTHRSADREAPAGASRFRRRAGSSEGGLSLSRKALAGLTAAKRATSTIPIVLAESTDPVGTGTGCQSSSPWRKHNRGYKYIGELGGKLLELLKEIVPRLSRVGYPGTIGRQSAEDVFERGSNSPPVH